MMQRLGVNQGTLQWPPYPRQEQPRFEGKQPNTKTKTAAAKQHKILVSLDVDDTLLPWNDYMKTVDQQILKRTIKTLKKYRDRLIVHINTGRSLATWPELVGFLKGVPADIVSLNNGQELFIRPEKTSPFRWLKSLTPKKENVFWKNAVRAVTGWNTAGVVDVFRQVFLSEGFQPLPPSRRLNRPGMTQSEQFSKTVGDETFIVTFVPDHSGITITSNKAQSVQALNADCGTALSEKIRKALGRAGFQVEMEAYSRVVPSRPGVVRVYAQYWYSPKGINKQTALQYALAKNPSVKAIISAGDHHFNDTLMLVARKYRHPKSGLVRNYPILSGENDILKKSLANHPQLEIVPAGDLGPALEKQISKIDQRQPAQ